MVLIKRDNSNNKLHPYHFRGDIERYIAKTDLSGGQPVCYTVDSSDNYIFKADSINTNHTYDNFLGICVLDVSGGEWASILTSGITFVNRITTYGVDVSEPTTAPNLRKLDSTTNGNTYDDDTYIKFTDSSGNGGDQPGDYGNGEEYNIKFDAGINNTWIMKIKDFSFEHSTYSLYDRLLLWLSDDDATYAKADISGWESTSSDDPYGTSSKGVSSTPKNVAPETTSEYTISINKRFLRWNFISDGSITKPGWEIYLWVPQPSEIILDGTLGNNVYVDTSGNVSDNINSSFLKNL
jgi:hypothetical protein